jgi:nicotinamidase/pyrazinamidase
VIDLYGHEQVLWPDHCVQATAGASLHPGLPREWVDAIIRKGNDPAVDSYSAFRNNWNRWGDRPPTGLGGYLRERGITHVIVSGLARDYCVKWTAEDAAGAGFKVRFLWDLTRPVESKSDERVFEELRAKGVEIERS